MVPRKNPIYRYLCPNFGPNLDPKIVFFKISLKVTLGGSRFFSWNNDFRDSCQPKTSTHGPDFWRGFGTSGPIALHTIPTSLYGGRRRSTLLFVQTRPMLIGTPMKGLGLLNNAI